MFNLKKFSEKSRLEEAREAALQVLDTLDPIDDCDAYQTVLDRVERLSNLHVKESPEKLSRNTLATVVGNIGVVAVIIGYERVNVIATKAPAFIQKLGR